MKKRYGARCRLWSAMAGLATLAWPAAVCAGNPDGSLRIEVMAAYNFVVDSNVESPSTYAPRSAYLGAKFYNDGTNALTNVWAYIGNFTNGTPGIYPTRTHPPLSGTFSLTHEGGSLGTADASRYLGTIQPGEYVMVYWLVSYPNVDALGKAVWGPSIKPDDDLWLNYSVWGTAMDAGVPLQADVTRKVTMRRMISAMANKIFPNGANKVPQEYQDMLAIYQPTWTNIASDGTPGTMITTEGIWYDLGNVGEGFDNNGDLVPDRNAWLQPVGDPALFDASCFRLVHTFAMVIVKLNDGTEKIYNVEDQLYFENIPENNRGAVGYVRYDFLPLRGGCSSQLTPYQEVASGYDNEKFNGDYGALLGLGLISGESKLQVTKSVDNPTIQVGQTLSYSIAFTNSGTAAIGGAQPLVITEKIPHGTLYIGLSAVSSNTLPSGVSSYTVLYSTNNGVTWQANEPANLATVTDVQWWLSDAVAAAAAGQVKLQVTVTTNAAPNITNTACATIGGTEPVACGSTNSFLTAGNVLGDLVWRDDGTGGGVLGNQIPDGTEAGITGVTVRLYYDANSNGVYDVGDYYMRATNTGASGLYSFTNLPDGYFVVVVETTNANIPVGYTPTTPTYWSIALDPARTNSSAVTNLTADFGFAPALTLIKTRTSTNAVREGQNITFNLTVSNNLPGSGTGTTFATTYVWATNGAQSGTEWFNFTNTFIPPGPDGKYASNNFAGASKILFLTNFPGFTQGGAITNVELLMPIIGASAASFSPNGTLLVEVQRIAPAQTIYAATYYATNTFTNTTLRMWTLPMTGTFSWVGTEFATNYRVVLTANKNAGGAGTGYLQVDAVGFRITSVSTGGTGTASTTLQPVPLTDQYDADKFQFISAYPPPTTSTTNGTWPNTTGTLYWSNLGPIYPGGTSTVAVTFKLLKPEAYTNMVTTNITWVTNATFQNGVPANMATSQVVVTQAPAAQVGDYVWRDLNGDGIQNETNQGIANVAVSLTPPPTVDLGNGLGQAITNWTDAYGYYLFESIPATGTYTVRVVTATLPSTAFTNTYDENGPLDSTAAVYLDVFAPPTSTNNVHLTTDFGYRVQSSIVGTIWHDQDFGQETNREAGEEWLTNVTVYLCTSPSPCGAGSALATNTTDTNGFFRFTNLLAGTYTVLVATNTGMMTNGTWRLSWDTDGTNTANYASVTVPSGGVARADFSYWRIGTFAIGDTLFYDWDGNGIQSNAWETGIANITMYLYRDVNGNGLVDTNTDAYIATTVTDTNGYYVFTNLYATNTYLVYVDLNDPDLPPRYFITADPWGAKDGRSVVTITTNSNYLQDFGFQPYGVGAIGDTVWRDLNADRVQSGPLETGISNILVSLYADLNHTGSYVLLRSTNTSTSGTYLFTNLPDGKYRVIVDATSTNLPVDAFSNRFYATTATYHDVTITNGNTYLDADFGFAPYAAIGDTVFWDANRNGTQDYSETGVSGVVVRLYYDANTNGVYDPGETLAASRTTDVNGIYLFSGLLPSNYVVLVVTTNGPLLGSSQSADPNSDGLACADPNNVVPCDHQYGRYLASGQNFMGADFGYIPPGVLGDLLWVDTNNNGIRDAGEYGIPYISVVLFSNNVAIATNETDADGYYSFSNLKDATYRVVVMTNDSDFPAGLTNTWAYDGTPDNVISNIVISNGVVVSVNGSACTGCDLSMDFGYRYSGNNSLSGTIGFDAMPYDGLMNSTNTSGVATNEAPYANVQVYLYLWNDNGNGIVEAGEYVTIASTTTRTNGDYSFTGLPAGDGNDKYLVASSAPEDYLKLTTTNGSIPGVTVKETTNVLGNTVSAYLIVPIQVGVTHYVNNDFAYRSTLNYDYGDLPDSYRTVLPDGARHVVPATTNLYLGARVDAEVNGIPTVGADGDDLTGGPDDEDGVFQITNTMWYAGATGSVRVIVGAGTGWLVGYIDFDGDGEFTSAGEMVCSLAVSNTYAGTGVYTNSFIIPSNVTFSATHATPIYARFRLFPSEPFLPQLAFSGSAANGEVEDYRWFLAGLGDYVWNDSNGDGVQDANEPAIVGVRVFIDLDADGQWDANEPYSVTDANGLYSIGGLVPGTYTVAVDTNTLPSGLTQTYDLDGIGTAHWAAATITSVTQFLSTVDFGYRGSATLGDRVWFDLNRDGIQNSGETNGLTNLTVALLNASSNVVFSTVTDANGYYLFGNIPAGTYRIRFDLTGISTNAEITPAFQGGNTELDSNVTNGMVGGYAWIYDVSIGAGETNLTYDLGLRTTSSTRAELAEVRGEWRGDGGYVVWRTRSEWDTAGFRVYRVDPETGGETLLNEEIVPSALLEDGAEYALADPEAVEGGSGTYRLEEAELTGGTVGHETHEIQFAPPPPAPKATRAVRTAPLNLAPTKLAGPSSVLKVLFQKESLYGVSLQAIATGMGLDFEEVQGLAEQNLLAFTEQGAPVPTIYDAPNARIVFHGRPTDNWYTRDNAILIAIGEGRPMVRREPGAAAGGTVFPVQVRFEEDVGIGNATMTSRPEDWYYWKMVTASVNPASNRVDFAFNLTGYAGGPVTLTVDLLGWTRTDRTPDHRAEFLVNGVAMGALEFDDQNTATAVLTIPEGVAMAGANTLTVRGALQKASDYSYFVVDGFTASYNRRLAPGAGVVHFRAGGQAGISAAAFVAPLAVALDEAGVPTWIADVNGALPGKAWAAAAENERFAVIETAELPLLAPEAAAADAWFLSADNRMDYLIISSRALADTAKQLADYRAGQGLRTGVAVFEDVCDLYAGGLRTPEAISELLAYAQATWAEAPWLAVLAGNGHYDYLGVRSNEVNHLPPLMLATMDGLFAADGLFADADGDALPEIALGRLPARNAADLTAMIAKIKAFEAEFGVDWQNRLVLTTDTTDDAAGSFMKVNDRIAALTSAAHPLAARIDLDTMAITPARTALTNWFKTGAGFIHYTGHGGAKNWSAKNLLRDTDVNVMTNARKPVAVALTCLSGRFEMPAVDNLGEMLLQRAQGGAVAVWSPSGLSRNAPAGDLGVAFYRAVLQEGCGRLGLAILQARRAVQGDFFSRDTLAVYNLLGDPALKIAGNTDRQLLPLKVQWQPLEGGTAAGGGVYLAGARAVLTATASNNWDFAGWSDGDTRNPRTVTVTHGGMTYTALFQRQITQVSVVADPPAGGSVTGGGRFGVGEQVVISAEAALNWEFVGWADGEQANPRLITVPAGGRTYTAQFRRITAAVKVVADPAAGGTVSGGGSYEVGSSVPISAKANPEWRFAGWDDGSMANPRTVPVVSGGASYTARFVSLSVDRDEALNRPGLEWRSGGAAPWFVQTRTTHDGISALQSGAIGDGQTSWLETTVTGPGWISFWWKVSSQASRDTLRLVANNGVRVGPVSGEVDWQWRSYWVPGPATLRWEYTKDARDAKGSDAGWLDQVLWWPRGPFGQWHDFDGDGLADGSTYDPNAQIWYQSRSSLGRRAVKLVLAGGLPAAADYDGDGATDLCLYQPARGTWLLRQSSNGRERRETFGASAAGLPVPGDYDGDGVGDLAVVHRGTSRWQIRFSGGAGEWSAVFGLPGMVPVPADYDGDAKTDLAVYDPANGAWHILGSASGQVAQQTLGGAGLLPVPADYDGDGRADLAVFNRKTATWVMVGSSSGGTRTVKFGTQEKNPVPVPADYDGDGRADLAVYLPAANLWYVQTSTGDHLHKLKPGPGQPTLPHTQVFYTLRLL